MTFRQASAPSHSSNAILVLTSPVGRWGGEAVEGSEREGVAHGHAPALVTYSYSPSQLAGEMVRPLSAASEKAQHAGAPSL